jgi:hypothetical protein
VSKKDTKELWKILNQFNNKNNKENQNDISLQTLFEHFKKPNGTIPVSSMILKSLT